MSKPESVHFHTVEFGRIEIGYELDNGHACGEAYFAKDDLCADVLAGEFRHPMTGCAFTFHAALPYMGRSIHTLEVTRPVLVAYAHRKGESP